MVFESVVTDVLNKILGDYVENLDRNQLKIGIWGGDVVLHHLKLRENALDELNLPVQLVYGSLGKLVLNIPWKNLYSQPVVAQIEDFYILIAPKQSVKYDQDKENKYAFQAKQAELLKSEAARKQELDKDKPQQNKSFTEKLTAQIVNNLQVTIANVHVRYEDTDTSGKPFSFGITLHGLDIYTADADWLKCYITEEVSKVFKVANLDSLSAYMNCRNVNLFTKYSVSEYPQLFKSNIAYADNIPNEYNYMIGPISSIAKLKLNMTPEYDSPPFEIPKVDLYFEMEKLNIGLTSTQFQDILKLGDTMNRMQLGAPYRKYRPFDTPYKTHYKTWWKFAINAILEEDIRRRHRNWSWSNIKSHRELCNTYTEAFKEKEMSKKPSSSIIESCNLCEKKLDLFNLILIRNRVHFEVDKIKEQEEKNQTNQSKSWFSSWWGGSKSDQDKDPGDFVKQFEDAMTPAEKAKLYSAIGYQETSAECLLPSTYEAIKLKFKLVALEIGVYNDSNVSRIQINSYDLQKILLLNFSLATCQVIQRPADNSIKILAGMKEMKLTGLEREQVTPTIIESMIPDEFNLLDIYFETNPIDKKCDQRIKISAKPLLVVYDSITVIELIQAFSTPKSVNLSELEGAASQKISNFKERSATGIQYMVDKHDILEVDIKLMPNILIIPKNGFYTKGHTSSVVVSFGKLSVTTEPRNIKEEDVGNMFESGKDKEEILKTMMAQAYDKFTVSIDDVQILVVKPEEKWTDVISNYYQTEMHVLRPTSMIVNADVCVIGDDPRLPKTIVKILIPSIQVNLTEDRIFEALNVITSIPLPENEPPAGMPLAKTESFASRLSVAKLFDPELMKSRTSNPKVDPSSPEIVQYTSLEVTFALKEFKVSLFAPNLSDIDTPSEVYTTPVDNMEGNIPFGDSYSILLQEKLLDLNIIMLEATMAARSYELVGSVKLGAINLNQHSHSPNIGETIMHIIDTPSYTEHMEYLLTVSYTNANKTSPEFTTKYNSTEQLIIVNFAQLDVLLHLECILKLLEIVGGLQTKFMKITEELKPKDHFASTRSDEGIITRLATITEEAEPNTENKLRKSSSRKQVKVVDSIQIKVVANLDQVSFELACNKRSIASLKVQHLFAGVVLKTSYTELTLKLKDILVTDLNPNTIHTTILSIVGDDALNCQVVIFNLDETSNYNSDDMKIDVTMGCVKIIFLNWFVTSVLSFMNNFQATQKALASASAAAADAAKQNVVDAYEKATRMKFNIKIKAPIIVVPVDSQSINGIFLDLGFLRITNYSTQIEVDHEKSPAILDEIKLELSDMKLSKVATAPISTTGEISLLDIENDLTEGLKENMNIFDPISFTLNIKRNLSSMWYKQQPEITMTGRLKSIEVNLFVDDYILLMSILNKNLTEGQNEFPQVDYYLAPEPSVTNVEVHDIAVEPGVSVIRLAPEPRHHVTNPSPSNPNEKVDEQLKFNFQFDGVVASLIDGNNEKLASFGVYYLSVRGQKLSDGTLSTALVLCDIQLDDIRSGSETKITKYLTRKESSRMSESSASCEYMLDAVAKIKDNDIFAEIRVSGFDLIISIEFLLKISQYFTIPESETVKFSEPKPIESSIKQSALTQQSPKRTVPAEINKTVKIVLRIDEPDIILVERLDDINTHAIIFNAQMNLNFQIIDNKQIICGAIKELKMYMCAFLPEKREATKHYIIHPCKITLQGSTPQDEGLHISLRMSNVILNISPATIELINKAVVTVCGPTPEEILEEAKLSTYENIWDIQEYSKEKDFWFIKPDKAFDAWELVGSQIEKKHVKTEKCIVEIPSIVLIFENGVGYYTSPLLKLETKLEATVSNWSENLTISGNLNLLMEYYNSVLAVWEPFIEPIERTFQSGLSRYGPWELTYELEMRPKKNMANLDEVEEASTTITVNSSDILQLTMTKTCIELLQKMGEDFSHAFQDHGLVKPEVVAPYVIENDTGFDVTIDFTESFFTLHECHMPRTDKQNVNLLNKSLVFQMSDTKSAVVNPDEVQNCIISSGGRIYLQIKKSKKPKYQYAAQNTTESYRIHVSIGDIKKSIILPVSKADKRYFPLYRDTNQDPWGIISEVTLEYGTTIINIQSVVKVHNHFTTTMKVFREKSLIGEIPPGEIFHVPLHAVYANSKELYFGLQDYKSSVQGIKWNDCLTDLNYCRQIQCDPLNTFEPFYINATREKTEVYHETSSKHTILSAFYTIHLRPPLYLRNALPIDIKVSVAGCSVRQDGSSPDTSITATDHSSSMIVKEDFLDYGEKDVNPGDVLHLPTVKLTRKSGEAKSFVVIRLIQYLEKDWSCTTEISEVHNEFETWTFTSYDSVAKMDMELGVRFENRAGSLMLTVYSPFWMINKTGLMLSYRANTESVNVLYHPPEYNGPILFSFREKHFFDKKRASIRVDTGDWSEKIPLDVAGSLGDVVCKANDISYKIGVHNHLTQNSLTKQITFIPFCVAINNCEFAIEIQEYNRPGDPWTLIEPYECVPYWPKSANSSLVVAKVAGEHTKTVPFTYTDVQCTLLKLEKHYGGLNVDVQVTEGGIYITFTQYNVGDAPGLVVNNTNKMIKFWEKGDVNKRELQPNEKVLFTWTDPAGDKILQFESDETDLRSDGVGQFCWNGGQNCKAYWVSFLDGLQRVLLFTDVESIANNAESSSNFHHVNQEIVISLVGFGLSVLNNYNGHDLLYLGITSSGVIWESRKSDKKRFKQMKIAECQILEAKHNQFLNHQAINEKHQYLLDGPKTEINFVDMKLMKSGQLRDIQRTFYPGVWIHLKTSPFQMQIHAKINRIQIDNQLPDCIFPVVLAPIPPPKSVAASSALKPFIECSIVERVVPNSNVKQFKYCSMLIQEFHFKVDLLFLTGISEMFTSEISDSQAAKLFNEDVLSIRKPLSDLVATHSQQEQKHFYDNLHLGPLKIHVSFSMAGAEPSALPNILSTIVQGVGVTLTDVNDVVFRLAFFEREFQFFTQKQLTSEITAHYSGQALKQLYVLVLGLDVLGNPFGLVVGLTKGVEDLFYEPFQGAIQGPGEFAEGLVLGVKSLFGHTVGGAAGAVSKITGAMGKGLAALTFDKDYQKKRRQALNKKPANFQEGIARSSKGLVMGVFDGVAGVLTKPISGAKEDGVEGFFKGLGKGAIGLVARPTAGVVDFASGSFDAVKRATENTEDIRRLRPPRFLKSDNIVRPYSHSEAKGNKLLKEIEKGKYAQTDIFSHLEEIQENHEILLVSNHRLILATKNDLFGNWTVQWTYRWPQIAEIKTGDKIIEIHLHKESKKIMGMFASSEQQKKIIPMPKEKRRDFLAKFLKTLIVPQ